MSEISELNKVLSGVPWENVDTLKVVWKKFDDQDGEVERSKFLPDIDIKMKDEVMP